MHLVQLKIVHDAASEQISACGQRTANKAPLMEAALMQPAAHKNLHAHQTLAGEWALRNRLVYPGTSLSAPPTSGKARSQEGDPLLPPAIGLVLDCSAIDPHASSS